MNDSAKGKYDVIKILRENVLTGLEAFGFKTVRNSPTAKQKWDCLECDQPSYRNFDMVVLVRMSGNRRVGWQSHAFNYVPSKMKFDQKEGVLEEQEWEIQAVLKRRLGPVSGDTVTTEDVAGILVTWFNGPGVDYFRSHGCANLYVNAASIKTYRGGSDVTQFRSVFTLKLQVPKNYDFWIDRAKVKYGGHVAVY